MHQSLLAQPELGIEEIPSDRSSWFESLIELLGVDQNSGWPDRFGQALQKYIRTKSRKKVRVLSLFSGGGGLDIAFHDAGFDIVECNELEAAFCKTLQKNVEEDGYLSGSSVLCKDIRNYTPQVKNIDFIIGGPPCQTFSAAGARAAGVNGMDDDRGNLFREYARILDQLKPQGFLFENVYRIVGAQDGRAWSSVQEAFKSIGYTLHWKILDAADYGAPQFRERLFIVGLKSGSYNFPWPTHGPDSLDRRPYYTSKQAIAGLPEVQNSKGLNGRHGHLLDKIPPGLNYSFFTEKMGHPNPIFGWRSKFSDYLYKADPERPVRTIKAQGGQYTGPFSWENRPFTVAELKRLQTFPDNYVVVGNRLKAIHQLGNSVPPQIGRVLAISILQQVFEPSLGFKIDLLPPNYQLGFRQRKAQLTEIYAKTASEAISRIDTSTTPLSKPPKKISFSVGANFSFNTPALDMPSFTGSYRTTKNKLHLSVVQAEYSGLGYEISMSWEPSIANILGSNSASIAVQSIDPISILATWKYFEWLIKSFTKKDDLVQLFGYYQYKNKYSVGVSLFDPILQSSPLWTVWHRISAGIGVGKIYTIQDLQVMYGSSEEIIRSSFLKLKGVGYEIRSRNSNRQIPSNSYLIPYLFPSLNERSLQRLTSI